MSNERYSPAARERRRVRSRDRYRERYKNPEFKALELARGKAYRDRDPAKENARARDYYERNRDRRIAIRKEWSRLNREWERETRRLWRERRKSGEPALYRRKPSGTKEQQRQRAKYRKSALGVARAELKRNVADLRNNRIGIDEFTRRVGESHARFNERIARESAARRNKKLRSRKSECGSGLR